MTISDNKRTLNDDDNIKEAYKQCIYKTMWQLEKKVDLNKIDRFMSDMKIGFSKHIKHKYPKFKLLQKNMTNMINEVIYEVTLDIKDEQTRLKRRFNISMFLGTRITNFDETTKKCKTDDGVHTKPLKYIQNESISLSDSEYDDLSDESYSDDDLSDLSDLSYSGDDISDISNLIDDKFEEPKNTLNTHFKKLQEKYTTNNSTENPVYNYFKKMNEDIKQAFLSKMEESELLIHNEKPLYVQVVESNLNDHQKGIVLHKVKKLDEEENFDSEYYKEKEWVEKILSVPFGVYKGLDLKKSHSSKEICDFLNNVNIKMNDAIYGHDDAKDKICDILAQEINNPQTNGCVLGLYGPPGNGKTSLIKDGISKAMDKPFTLISLGGATDASFLEGHSYTYVGALCGKIVDSLIESKCMNPIIYFDELDKVSETKHGEEIINVLIHLIDPSQNTEFTDKYFNGIHFDLSKATFIFSFNDIRRINHVLLDRITEIHVDSLNIRQKIHITKNYLLPNILKEVGLSEKSIIIKDNEIEWLIENYTSEGGVRKLKEHLFHIIRKINRFHLTKEKMLDNVVKYPFNVKINQLKKIFFSKKAPFIPEKINTSPKVGVINGLYACSNGVGGSLPVQVYECISSNVMTVKRTGNLKDVMKESVDVATTLAWSLISDDIKESLMKKWKKTMTGLHVHFSDGATKKDGPSAGTAITVAIYSLLTNKKISNTIAITGEITLEGKVKSIGGLESKLYGAKKAGVKTVLYPVDNIADVEIIKKKDNKLIDESFSVIPISTINEAIKYSIKTDDNKILHVKHKL
jgi:endopeptidase La